MKMYTLVVIGLALLILGVAKVGGLAYQLAAGADMPDGFVAKQAVYAVACFGLGVIAVRAGRERHAEG